MRRISSGIVCLLVPLTLPYNKPSENEGYYIFTLVIYIYILLYGESSLLKITTLILDFHSFSLDLGICISYLYFSFYAQSLLGSAFPQKFFEIADSKIVNS